MYKLHKTLHFLQIVQKCLKSVRTYLCGFEVLFLQKDFSPTKKCKTVKSMLTTLFCILFLTLI
nr:MAG TPA: hypothetical protein [Bacteriophage sp.]